jgi:exodeoxyribonuclease VII small subunit
MSEAQADEPTIEDSLLQLERLVRELEDGQLGLEDSLARYEEGVGLIKRCHARLRAAEQRILQLSGTNDAGEPVLQAFKHEATAAKSAGGPAPVRLVPKHEEEIG